MNKETIALLPKFLKATPGTSANFARRFGLSEEDFLAKLDTPFAKLRREYPGLPSPIGTGRRSTVIRVPISRLRNYFVITNLTDSMDAHSMVSRIQLLQISCNNQTYTERTNPDFKNTPMQLCSKLHNANSLSPFGKYHIGFNKAANEIRIRLNPNTMQVGKNDTVYFNIRVHFDSIEDLPL